MIVLVDTPVWSAALRRKKKSASETATTNELASLIASDEASLIGPIRQEVLAGIRDPLRYEAIRLYLRGFEDIYLPTTDYELAAALENDCRSRGVQASHVDFLLCAVARRLNASIFSTDHDFRWIAPHTRISLHAPRGA